MKLGFLPFLMLFCLTATAQDSGILKTILKTYYQNEKVIVKDRTQLLFLYCEKPNNNEELYDAINQLKLKPPVAASLRKKVISDNAPKNWSTDYADALPEEHPLRKKVNECKSLEQFHEIQKKSNLNYQRLLIIHKPLYIEPTKALVKIVFYRTIEHNSGSVLLMEKVNDGWVIREKLNNWST
jgi:hypothetical protein